MLAEITFILPGTGHPVDPGFGVTPPTDPGFGQLPGHGLPPGSWTKPGGPSTMPPVALPPLPGVYPPPGQPSVTPPVQVPPPGVSSPPIHIPIPPGTPDNSLPTPPVPPGTGIWPPLPPDTGLKGKVAILVWVVGVGHRWFIVDTGQTPPAGPK